MIFENDFPKTSCYLRILFICFESIDFSAYFTHSTFSQNICKILEIYFKNILFSPLLDINHVFCPYFTLIIICIYSNSDFFDFEIIHSSPIFLNTWLDLFLYILRSVWCRYQLSWYLNENYSFLSTFVSY